MRDQSRQQVEELKAEVRRRYICTDAGVPFRRPGMPKVVAAMEISCVKGNTIKELRDLVYNTASEIRVQTPGTASWSRLINL